MREGGGGVGMVGGDGLMDWWVGGGGRGMGGEERVCVIFWMSLEGLV